MPILVNLLTAVGAVLGSVSAVQCQPPAFYTSEFEDRELVSLVLRDAIAAEEPGFDYDVLIDITRGPAEGTGIYTDPSTHKAAVRCYNPGAVMINARLYHVSALGEGDWKLALWNFVCSRPAS